MTFREFLESLDLSDAILELYFEDDESYIHFETFDFSPAHPDEEFPSYFLEEEALEEHIEAYGDKLIEELKVERERDRKEFVTREWRSWDANSEGYDLDYETVTIPFERIKVDMVLRGKEVIA